MGKIDEQKEYIGALKVYLGFLIAVILTLGAGISKLYLVENFNLLFWFGIILLMGCFILFALISKTMHKKISELKDL